MWKRNAGVCGETDIAAACTYQVCPKHATGQNPVAEARAAERATTAPSSAVNVRNRMKLIKWLVMSREVLQTDWEPGTCTVPC